MKNNNNTKNDKEALRLIFAALYDANYSGLEADWIRLCERFSTSFRFDFDGKSLDRILDEFMQKQIPVSMLNTLKALRYRRVLFTLESTLSSLTAYAETLRRDLDESTDGELAHAIRIRFTPELVEVEIQHFDAADAPAQLVSINVAPAHEITEIETLRATDASGHTLRFVRLNNQFDFSPAFAQSDANEIFGFVLAHSEIGAGRLSKTRRLARRSFQSG